MEAIASSFRKRATNDKYVPSIGLDISTPVTVVKKSFQRWVVNYPLANVWIVPARETNRAAKYYEGLGPTLLNAFCQNRTQIFAGANYKTDLEQSRTDLKNVNVRGLFCQFFGRDVEHAYPTVYFAHRNLRVREQGHEFFTSVLDKFSHEGFYGDFELVAFPYLVRNLAGKGSPRGSLDPYDAPSGQSSAQKDDMSDQVDNRPAPSMSMSDQVDNRLAPSTSQRDGEWINLCGSTLYVKDTNQSATFGGVIRANDDKYYGLTVAHVFRNMRDDDEEYEVTVDDNGEAEESVFQENQESQGGKEHIPDLDWEDKRHSVAAISKDSSLDWAVVRLDHDRFVNGFPDDLPRIWVRELIERTPEWTSLARSGQSQGDLHPISEIAKPLPGNLTIVSKRGRLEGHYLGKVLSTASADSNCHMIQLESGKLVEGDSGSWILNENGAVCGILVRGITELNIGYFVPFKAVLEDIKSHLPPRGPLLPRLTLRLPGNWDTQKSLDSAFQTALRDADHKIAYSITPVLSILEAWDISVPLLTLEKTIVYSLGSQIIGWAAARAKYNEETSSFLDDRFVREKGILTWILSHAKVATLHDHSFWTELFNLLADAEVIPKPIFNFLAEQARSFLPRSCGSHNDSSRSGVDVHFTNSNVLEMLVKDINSVNNILLGNLLQDRNSARMKDDTGFGQVLEHMNRFCPTYKSNDTVSLSRAIRGSCVLLVEILLKTGSDASTFDSLQTGPPLVLATEISRSKVITKALLDAGADLFATDIAGRTALSYAVELGEKEVALLKRYDDVWGEGMAARKAAALRRAVKWRDKEMVTILLVAGAEPHISDSFAL